MTNPGTLTQRSTNGTGPHASTQLSPADLEIVRGVAALLTDVIPAFAVAAARHVHEQLPELPQDAATVESTRLAAEGNPREVLSTLRAGMPPSAHETPVEALEHVRFLDRRGVGLTSLLGIYKYGTAMFRNVVTAELAARVEDPAQLARITQAADDYLFRYITTVTKRLAAEYGVHEGGWHPTVDDPVLTSPASADAARRLREEEIARRAWVARTPDESNARQAAERALEAFATTIEHGAHDDELGHLLALADTTVTVTLACEPDLSVTLLLDRDPVEVVDGVADADGRIWIASVDLNRLWSRDFYLAMAITKGRVRMDGTVRKFLRIVPILRTLAGAHGEIAASLQTEEAH
jgi:hypothetical protein